jgi:hypothetical protein
MSQAPPTIPAPPATVLHPAARLLWRSGRAVQIELGERRVVIDGVGSDTVWHLIGHPSGPPADPAAVAHLQARLLENGLVWPGEQAEAHRAVPHPRLAGELTALSARAGERAGELISARRQCAVAVHGAGRVGAHVAAVLAAAGVGRVHTAELAPVRLHQTVPGGVTPADEGRALGTAAAAAAELAAPDAVCVPPPFGHTPDLVVLAVDEPVDAERRDSLHARSCAHLLVRVSAGHGSVGPLVIPGLTSCLRCADLHRLDRDPAWDALAVQLSIAPRYGVASEVALATVVAGLAAVQALEFLDGGRPAGLEGSLEMQLPDWRLRRRSRPAHPDCDCMSDRPDEACR